MDSDNDIDDDDNELRRRDIDKKADGEWWQHVSFRFVPFHADVSAVLRAQLCWSF